VKFEEFSAIYPNAKQLEKTQLNEILSKDGLKILTGSLYMIGEMYEIALN
jgi:hypothetical protein